MRVGTSPTECPQQAGTPFRKHNKRRVNANLSPTEEMIAAPLMRSGGALLASQ
jgi:hypothetical protein